MGKHSQNNTARSFHTYAEKKKMGYGTQKARIGQDSQIPFGYCCLGLVPAVNPVATPHGRIYSRDAIVENLAEQKMELKRKARAFEEQERRAREEAEEEEHASKRRRLEELEELDTKAAVAPKLHQALSVKEVKKGNTGFWLPINAPEGKVERLVAPPKHTLCPTTQKPLRLKDLIPLNVEWEESSSKKGTEKRMVCAVSKKAITCQKAVCLKPSGVVVLESCFKEIVQPTMTCPVTGKKLEDSDVIALVPGGTGFAAHSKVETKVYQPNI